MGGGGEVQAGEEGEEDTEAKGVGCAFSHSSVKGKVEGKERQWGRCCRELLAQPPLFRRRRCRR